MIPEISAPNAKKIDFFFFFFNSFVYKSQRLTSRHKHGATAAVASASTR